MLKYRIAILSNFTFETITRHLDKILKTINATAEYYISGFNQYAQDILNPDSQLYRFKPELVVLALEGERLFSSLLQSASELPIREKQSRIDKILAQIDELFKSLTHNSHATILCHNFITPLRTWQGILDTKQELGVREIYQNLNNGLGKISRVHAPVFIFDIESLSAGFGKNNIRDEKLHYLAAMDLSEDFLTEVAKEYLRYLKPLKGLSKKCLVLDLDNVLWGGIIGEDGLGGIKLGQEPPGNIYLDFQQVILDLYKKGVILCINSRNNFEDAMEVFRRHPAMLLKEEHFACLKINWLDKAANLEEMSKELNLSLDSFVFIDDSPYERRLIKQLLPQVEVVDLPEDPALFRKTIESLDFFESLFLTEDDRKRGLFYARERKRKEFKGGFKNLDEFLNGLKIRCYIKPVDEISLSRVAQLIQRTNQFNLTTPRYSESQLRTFLKRERSLFLMVSLEDIFGDSGIVGAAILLEEGKTWNLDTFLLSCRVLGRKVEYAFLGKVIEHLKAKGADSLSATFIPTKKNAPAKDFLGDFGFRTLQTSAGDNPRYCLELNKKIEIPRWIKVKDG